MTPTRRLLLATALAGSMLPQAGLASTADFLARHAVTPEDLAGGRALDERGLGFLAASQVANGAILFEGAAMKAPDGRILEAEELMVSDKVVMLRTAVLSRDADNEAFSKVSLDSVRIEGPDAARLIMMGPDDVCAPMPAVKVGSSRIDAQGIKVTAPSLGQRAGMKADEELSISSLEMGFTWTEEDCGAFDYLRMRALSSETPEGDKMTVAGAMATLETSEEGQVQLGLTMTDAAFTSAAAESITRAGNLRMTAAMPEAWLAEGTDKDSVDWSDPAAALVALAGNDASFGLEITGLELPMGDLMPKHVLDKLKLGKGSQYGGQMTFNLASSEGKLALGHDIRMAGLANSAANIEVEVDPRSVASQASMGVLGIASAANLVSASFSHKDLGLNSAVQAATGMDLGELVRESAAGIPGPASATAPIIDWLAVALTTEGNVEAAPAQPVPLMQIGMTLAMAPKSLVNILNLTASE